MPPILAYVAVEILTFYLLFLGGAWAGLYDWRLRVVSLGIAVITAVVWALLARRDRSWRPRSVLLPVGGLALASLALSTVLSREPRQSVEYLAFAGFLLGGYLLLVRILAHDGVGRRLLAVAMVLALAVPGMYVFTTLVHWIGWWSNVGRVTVPPLRPDSDGLTFGNPSAVLTATLLLAGPGMALALDGRRGGRVLVALIAAGAAWATIVSASRAGWFALAIAVPLFVVAWLAPAERRRALLERARRTGRAGAGAAAVLAIGAAGAAVVLGPLILRRLSDGGQDLRLNYVKAAVRMFGESPIWGTGPGTWVIGRIAHTLPTETDYYIPHAHDVYAQTLAELGLVGVLVGALAVAAVAWLIRDGIRDADPGRRRWGWAALFSVLYLAAHQVLDFYMNFPGILFLAALPLAMLDAAATRGPSLARLPGAAALARVLRRPSLPWPTTLPDRALPALLVVALVAGAGLAWSESVAATADAAVQAANAGDWAAADPLAAKAAADDPAWPPYQMDAGLTAARAGDHQRAADAFARVVAVDPFPEALVDLAAEQAALGRTDAAMATLDHAARLGLQRPGPAMAIGELAARLGLDDLALRGYAAAVSESPSLASDPWWTSAGRAGPPLARIVDGAIAQAAPGSGWVIAMFAGDAARARSLAAAREASGGVVPALDVVAAYEGDEAAYARILAAADAHPLDAGAQVWAARLAFGRGQDELALDHAIAGQSVSSGSGGSALLMRVVPADKWTLSGVEVVAIFWGPYTYRRTTPYDLLVPSLVHLRPVPAD